jgi:hypothetical protein
MMETEKEIEKTCCKILQDHGCLTPKWINPFDTGWPDRIIVPPNKPVFFIEFKRPNGRLSKKQIYKIQQLRSQGPIVAVISSIEELNNLIEVLEL